MEAMSREEDCFLEQPQWIKLYRSVAEDSDHLTERSTLTVNIRSYLFYMPGLWHDIGRLVNGPELFDDYATAALESRCRKAQNDFIDWMEDYKAHCVRTSLATPTQQELALRRELVGMAVECLAVVKRLLATVCDHGNEKLESEAQALAHLILDLQNQPSTKHSWLFREHEVGVSHTVEQAKFEIHTKNCRLYRLPTPSYSLKTNGRARSTTNPDLTRGSPLERDIKVGAAS